MIMAEICDICGDRGFSNALLDCSDCSVASAHQYCLGIPPGSIDDTFDWVCESCYEPMESESCQFGAAFSLESALQNCSQDLEIESRGAIVALPEQPQPLCMLLPIQYHESSTRGKTSNLSQTHEVLVSSFMEHPDSIMRGIILLVSPSGEVFIDEEKNSSESSYFSSLAGQILDMTRLSKKSGTYKVKRESSPGKTVENYVGSTGTIELHDLKLQSLSEADGYEENDDVPSVSALSKLDGGGGSGSLSKDEGSMEDRQRQIRKRTVEPEAELIQRKKATVYKAEGDAEGPSSQPLEDSKDKHELIKRKTDKCSMKSDRNRELSSGTALAQTQKSVRKQIVTMLLSAGWTVEYRPRKAGKRKSDERVYVNPQGKAYWSVPLAYRSLEQDFEKAKANKSEFGDDGSGNSNFCFKPLSKELLSVLSRSKHDK